MTIWHVLQIGRIFATIDEKLKFTKTIWKKETTSENMQPSIWE